MERRVSKETGNRRPLRRPLERNSRERMGFCFSVLAKRANSEMRAKKFSERAALWGKRERLLFLERWQRGQHLQRSAVVRRAALECGNCRVQRMENVP